ncbi:hypothetical protein [Corynebacterium sp. MC3]|uniref:hypothetical protein n=1 Tax=Corynebacterium sp. MC3 TaxID=1720193 RepID=UPI0008DB0D96|nr:hypothetical protein [Corynebacterium sp. MC3]
MTRGQQIFKLTKILQHIKIPADPPWPEVDLRFEGPVDRIATHLYDACGVRVEEEGVTVDE